MLDWSIASLSSRSAKLQSVHILISKASHNQEELTELLICIRNPTINGVFHGLVIPLDRHGGVILCARLFAGYVVVGGDVVAVFGLTRENVLAGTVGFVGCGHFVCCYHG